MKWIGGPNHNLTVWLVLRCEKNKKNMFLIFSNMMQCFITIFIMVLIIEEVIVYNFHKKYLDFCKKKSGGKKD